MKVKDLLQTIELYRRDYKDFLEWDIALEQVDKPKKEYVLEHKDFDGKWKFVKSYSMGCNTVFKKEKVFGIQIRF